MSENRRNDQGKEPAYSEPVARFEIHHTRFLDADGKPVQSLPAFAQDVENLIPLYRAMLMTRLFDNKAVALQRTGQLGTYASSMGQEAIGAAIGTAMKPMDVLVPAYREYAAQFLRGVTMTEILMYWGGNEQGMNFKVPRRDFPICVPIASQVPHAVGVAYAMKLRKELRVAVCVLGDGATSKGDFYESINAAGTWKLPMVFVINNNQWAISLPRQAQSSAETLSQKAIAAGIEGEQVDGNDVIALRYCFERALDKARHGGEPSVIEALTYRLCDHTTADDASRYRSTEELKAQMKAEPLVRLRNFLTDSECWSDEKDKALTETLTADVEAAVKVYLNTSPQPPGSMFDYLYQDLPRALSAQRQEVIGRSGSHD
ncbi:MAG: pyruvate dehydrogenase (acetyl-transferring) E1 component subunit alpha [Pseudomonadota bacterium]